MSLSLIASAHPEKQLSEPHEAKDVTSVDVTARRRLISSREVKSTKQSHNYAKKLLNATKGQPHVIFI